MDEPVEDATRTEIEEAPGGWRWAVRRGKRTLGGTCPTQAEAEAVAAEAADALQAKPEVVEPAPPPLSRQQRRAAQRAARKL